MYQVHIETDEIHQKSVILNRYIMLGRGICKKYQLRDEKFPRAERRGKFSLKTGIFRKYPSQT